MAETKTQVKRTNYADGGRGEFSYRGEKRHGPWRSFFANGQQKYDRHFVNDREHGTSRQWNVKGVLIEEKSYRDNVLHGRWRRWDDNGTLLDESEFLFGDEVRNGSLPEYSGEPAEVVGRLRPLSAADSEQHYSLLLNELRRPVNIPKLGRPIEDRISTVTSVLGAVTHLPAEMPWPERHGQRLSPLLQLRVDELAAPLNALTDISVLQVFGARRCAAFDDGYDLDVRTYRRLEDLDLVTTAPELRLRSPVHLDWAVQEAEYPDRQDLPPGLLAYLDDERSESPLLEHGSQLQTKVGGWPSWLQFSRLRDQGDFVLQLDSLDFEDWRAGDSTVFYLFRTPGEDHWCSIAESC